MTTLLAVVLATLSSGQTTNISNYLQTDLQDATFVAEIQKGNQRELAKINKDFGQAYRFQKSKFYFKEPLKMRAEATVDDSTLVYILNGTNLWLKVPSAHVSSKQDLSKSPGRRQTLMDIGILTPPMFASLLDAKFVRNDRETGDVVFDLTYKPILDDTSRYRVWVDKTRKFVTRREWYNQYGRELATFIYSNPTQVNGVWLPTHMQVRNVDNMVAGETKYDLIRINSGLSDSLFDAR